MVEQYYYRGLDTKVLVVAVVNNFNDGYSDWSAYVGAVEGRNHDKEFKEVARCGSKIDRRIAKIIFPTLAEKHRWRD